MKKEETKKTGEYWIIKNLLDAMREARQRYKMAEQDQIECENQQNDILHAMEFGSDNWTQSQLAKKMREVRTKRRKAKNTILSLEPIVTWYADNQDVIKDLEIIQGKTKKLEDQIAKRIYVPRTNILDSDS